MLKSLELSGFKSFVKKTELNFKSQITAIVGPNGSGKSNVAEAFRFVLGEQSIKSMRGKRGEDLIWNGSTEIGRSNRAAVKLVFAPTSANAESGSRPKSVGNNFKDTYFEEIIIERIVNRDGTNEYYLNGSLVRLKDIIELLYGAHIGASGHHIISQGEADRILTANIRERKEMVEDALGLKIYQYKREESERKLLKTEDNIKQVESLRREIAPHLRFLKKQAERVEKAEELRVKLTKFYREYLKREKIYLEGQKKQVGAEKRPLIEKLERLEEEMEKAKEVLNDSLKKDEKSEKLIEIENKIKNERDDKDRLYREVGKTEGEINANNRNIEKIKAEQKSEENKTVSLKELEELEKELSAYSEIIKIIEKIRGFIAKHRNNFNDKNLNELVALNQTLENNKVVLEDKIKNVDAILSKFASKYQEIKNSIEKDKDSERTAEKNIFRISGERNEVSSKIEFLKERERRLSLEENDWKREIQEGGVLLGTAIVGFENDEIESSRRERPLQEGHRVALAGSTRPSLEDFPVGLSESRDKQEDRRRELEKMKIRLEELGGAGGAEVMKEYKESVGRDEFLAKELGDLKKSAESLEILIKELLERLDIEFKQGIEKINKSFQNFFSLMFGGGEAELQVVKEKTKKKKLNTDENEDIGTSTDSIINGIEDKEEETKEGIDISVSLPRKKIKGLDMLSGGERALTSIALLFAISQVNPPPFIILDETDAALDE
ncbi:MAG: hypothetical protein A3I19_00800, partial [Candidatus Zambryskibacteria bacterium RIFCSPLOWO2_02_FULL_38_13]